MVVPELNQNAIIPAKVPLVKKNFMNSTENPDPAYNANSGTEILPGQKGAMNSTIKDKSYYTVPELLPKEPKK